MSDANASGDSSELEALFDSIASGVAPSSTPPSAEKKPSLMQQAREGNNLTDDSKELQDLFDSIVSKSATSGGAVASEEGAVAEDWPSQKKVFTQVGQMARQLHDTLGALGYDKLIEQTVNALPDAKDRLTYIANLTEQAACKVLNATDVATPIQEELEEGAALLTAKWDALYAKQMGVEDFKLLAAETRSFLKNAVPQRTAATKEQLMEIMMAQDFQDLTGQVIKKVVALAQQLESQLMGILIETIPGEKRTESVTSLLNGPVVNAEGRLLLASSRSTICWIAWGSRRFDMSDFSGMEDLLQDFLQEASDLLSDVDNRLVELERDPEDRSLLNDIFRGFHTIKGGAGFLNATELVTLCHLTENLFDKLRNGEMTLTPELLDIIMAATQGVRCMFGELGQSVQPKPAPADVIQALRVALHEMEPAAQEAGSVATSAPASEANAEPSSGEVSGDDGEPDWQALHAAVTGAEQKEPSVIPAGASPDLKQAGAVVAAPEVMPHFPPEGRRSTDKPALAGSGATGGRRSDEKIATRESTIRVDTARLDQVLNLSGEIGLTKNRLTSLRADILAGRNDSETLHALDQAVSQLDLLVSDLQNSVMKTRMQPIGRLFQKYPRIARDLARQLGKDVELALVGEETEVDKTMIEDLADPLVHLVRNAVDHGVESQEERLAAGKPTKSVVRLEARQEGDHIVLIIADDGRGMSPERIRAKAVEKGLIKEEEANTLDDRQSLNLIFLPGFSTMTQASAVSGRGVGMDVVKTNIQKLNGSVEIRSELGKGTVFLISLPLTLAILPVLLVLLGDQPFALPLSMVREILPIEKDKMQEVGGKETLVVRGEVLPVVALSRLLGWPQVQPPEYGVLMQAAERSFILSVDSFAGRDDAVIKSLDDFRPRGVAGVTTLSNGQIVLILDMKELLADLNAHIDRELGVRNARSIELSI